MQIISDLRSVTLSGPTFLTIGNFDGLHRGHQALLQMLRQHAAARSSAARTALLTFDPHPLAVLRPDLAPRLLTTPLERLRLAGEQGIDFGILQPFDEVFAALAPRQLMQQLKRHLGLAALVIGPDFALGRNRSGDAKVLTALGEELDYHLDIIQPIDWEGRNVRSSVVRSLIQAGEVNEAGDLLGRFYHVSGRIIHGDQRGRLLGFPTANLEPSPDKLLPAYGVYATYCRLNDVAGAPVFGSVTNVGVRPTVDGLHLRVESYLLDFPPAGMSDNLYGQSITLEFVERLRGEQRFASIDALRAQIARDAEQARQVL